MNKKHILIDREKLNISNWLAIILFIGFYFITMILFAIIDTTIASIFGISQAFVTSITFYIRAFIILSLIFDLLPKLKRFISILLSLLFAFIYLYYDKLAGDYLYLGTLVFLISIILYNIFLFIRYSHSKRSRN